MNLSLETTISVLPNPTCHPLSFPLTLLMPFTLIPPPITTTTFHFLFPDASVLATIHLTGRKNGEGDVRQLLVQVTQCPVYNYTMSWGGWGGGHHFPPEMLLRVSICKWAFGLVFGLGVEVGSRWGGVGIAQRLVPHPLWTPRLIKVGWGGFWGRFIGLGFWAQ